MMYVIVAVAVYVVGIVTAAKVKVFVNKARVAVASWIAPK